MVAMTLPTKPWVNGMMTADGTRMFDSSVGSEGAWRATPIPAGGLPAGSIIQWSSNTAPPNWFIADGSAISRTLWPSLFAVIGTTYGSGDGSTTFNLPDLRGRVAVGKNAGTFGTIGATGGAETNTHKHWTLTGHNAGDPATYYRTGSPNGVRTQTTSRRTIAEGSYSSNATTWEDATYDATINTLPPYLVTNYIIKATTGWSAGDSQLATRVGNLEIADATTNRAGLVPIIPVSVDKGAGTVSVSSTGVVTLTNVTNFSLNGVFSALFKNYMLILEGKTASAVLSGDIRLRSGVTDATSADYAWFGPRSLNWNGISMNGTTGGTTWALWDTYSGGQVSLAVADIFRPFDSVETKFSSMGYHYSNSIGTSNYIGHHKLANSYDGLTFVSSAQTPFTGTIQILGYR